MRRARGFLGSLDSGVWDFSILREYLLRLDWGTTAILFRVKRGLVVSHDTGVTVGLDCAMLGSAGDRDPPLARCAGVVVWASGLVSLVRDGCGFRVPLRFVALLVWRVGPRGVFTSG